MTYKATLLITCLLLSNLLHPAIAQQQSNASINQHLNQLQLKVTNAITKFEQTHRENWAYKATRFENEEGEITSSIEQYLPLNPPEKQWQLLQINGKSPSKKQEKKFIKKKLKQKESKKSGANYALALREIINIDSLEFISENDSHIKMQFDVYLKKLGDDAKGKLKGHLFYNKHQTFIETMTITSHDEFSPVFSANITDFTLTFNFINIEGDILTQQHDMAMKGTFAFFTEINETSTDTFSDYEKHKTNEVH